MRLSSLSIGVGLSALLLTHHAIAQNEPNEMSLTLGFVSTSGNTDTQSYNGEFRATWYTTHWTHNLKLRGMGSREDGSNQAERYYFEEKSDYNLNNEQYLFVRSTYTNDRFSGFDYQASLGTGYGRHLVNSGNFTLQGFSGLGYRLKKHINGVDNSRDGELALTLGEELGWDLSQSTSLYQELNSEIGTELVVTTFEVGLETNIIGGIATKFAFLARHNSTVPEEREHTDTQTSVSLVYSF